MPSSGSFLFRLAANPGGLTTWVGALLPQKAAKTAAKVLRIQKACASSKATPKQRLKPQKAISRFQSSSSTDVLYYSGRQETSNTNHRTSSNPNNTDILPSRHSRNFVSGKSSNFMRIGLPKFQCHLHHCLGFRLRFDSKSMIIFGGDSRVSRVSKVLRKTEPQSDKPSPFEGWDLSAPTTVTTPLKSNRMALLRSCKKLYLEAPRHMYKDFILCATLKAVDRFCRDRNCHETKCLFLPACVCQHFPLYKVRGPLIGVEHPLKTDLDKALCRILPAKYLARFSLIRNELLNLCWLVHHFEIRSITIKFKDLNKLTCYDTKFRP